MEMWPQGLVWPSLSGRIIFQVPLALPARNFEPQAEADIGIFAISASALAKKYIG